MKTKDDGVENVFHSVKIDIDGVILENHGGRSGCRTIHTLAPEGGVRHALRVGKRRRHLDDLHGRKPPRQ